MAGSTPVFTAGEFVAVFNQSIGTMFPMVGIVGELSSFQVSKNRWLYFNLKDQEASIKFFGTVQQLPGPLEDGMQLEVIGRPYLHPKFGFSIQVMSIRPVGEGTIKKAQELLFARLENEGLFDEARKRPLPYPPEKIALISSRESAAYSDFMKIVSKRWPSLEIRLFDVHVQGQDAPAQIVEAIEACNMAPDTFDVVVMIRGGGSSDDLASFSVEKVVRAVAASRIPTLVAIGHERDVSVSELAADKRASTPSNAAELLVPDLTHEHQVAKKAHRELTASTGNILKARQKENADYKKMLSDAVKSVFSRQKEFHKTAGLLLEAMDPHRPLERGYALVRSIKGEHIKTAANARRQQLLSLEFSDDKLQVRPIGNE